MKCLRKLMLSALLALAVVSPLAVAPQAQAHPPGHGHVRVFYVYYRSCCHSPWVCYGGYYDAHDAQHAAQWFRYNGYEVFVR